MSNKTHVKQLDAIESAPNSTKFKKYLGISLFVIIFLLFLYSSIRILYVYLSTDTLSAPDGTIQIEIADEPQERQLGLSGRNGIDENSGMLFVFDNSSKQNCFWMKDMKFPIDMVWMNREKEVVFIAENISPDTYPKVFCPETDAKYGLELSSGNAKRLQIVNGSKLRW